MKTYAIYRGLYGADFVRHSIESVLPHVDKVIFVWGGRPWANASEWTHKGKRYTFPKLIDNLPEVVKGIDDPRVHFVEAYHETPRGQLASMVNDIVIPQFGRPDVALFMMPNYVWKQDALASALDEFTAARYRYANTWQVEMWRGFDYRIPRRERTGPGFCNLREMRQMPMTDLNYHPTYMRIEDVPMLGAESHNLRYSENLNTLFWRQLVTEAWVATIHDSKPDPDHFEEKLLNWTPETRDLEMALAYKARIPKAEPYDFHKLPEVILRDIDKLRKSASNAAWKGYPKCE
jgi:hypothetical protein